MSSPGPVLSAAAPNRSRQEAANRGKQPWSRLALQIAALAFGALGIGWGVRNVLSSSRELGARSISLIVAGVTAVVWAVYARSQSRPSTAPTSRLPASFPDLTASDPEARFNGVCTFIRSQEGVITANRGHEFSKQRFTEGMRTMFRLETKFPRPVLPQAGLPSIDNYSFEAFKHLLRHVQTLGVQHDLPRESQNKEFFHVSQTASQYNAAEYSPGDGEILKTPGFCEAMKESEGDWTQGPLSQRTNPAVFEWVTAALSNGGFSMLQSVFSPDLHKTVVQHGFLLPSPDNVKDVTQFFKDNLQQMECVTYTSVPEGGQYPIEIVLQAAPAISHAMLRKGLWDLNQSAELQQLVAFANYTILIQRGIARALEGKNVVVHATAVGGGDFGNQPENLAWGLKMALLANQEALQELPTGQFILQLENFGGKDPAINGMRDALKIPEGLSERIGEASTRH